MLLDLYLHTYVRMYVCMYVVYAQDQVALKQQRLEQL